MKFKAISLLTVSVLLATASPAMAGNNSHTEVRTPLSISALELHSVSKTEVAINEALAQAMPHIEDPEKFEASFVKYLEAKGYSADTSLPSEHAKSSASSPAAVPAVIIAARFALCVSSAYTVLAAIPKNAPYVDKAMGAGAALAGCIGGGAAGSVVGRWILNNPRIAAGVFNAVGLGHLAGDSSRG